ncbi:MAG TPA: glycosyltransferase [Acidocella sp.]|nr:glycosyltransferase [Acidocella sp.]
MLTIHMTTHRRFACGLLRRAVKSVLSQSFRDFEFIICDDASTDGTADYLKDIEAMDPRVRVIRNLRNVNSVAISLGRCLKAASADRPWVSWMFDDCVLLPDALRCLVNMTVNHRLEMVYGITNVLKPDGGVFPVGDLSPEEVRQRVAKSSVLVPNGGILIKRQVFDRHGWYDPSIVLRRSCDWDLFRRIIGAGTPFAATQEVVMEEYGALQTDSLRNAFTTTFDLMMRFAQARDKTGLRLGVDEILHMPMDWIPPNDWSSEELGLIRYIFMEYFLSVADMPRAFRWAALLAPQLQRDSLMLQNLKRKASEGDGSVSLMAAGAYAGLVLEAYRRCRETAAEQGAR